MVWNKKDWEKKDEESEELKTFRVEWTRDTREYLSGIVEARNREEAIREFEWGNITDIDIEDEEILDERLTSIEEEE